MLIINENMKKLIFILTAAMICLSSCSKKEETLNCRITWQLYHQPKYITESEIEKTFQETFFGFYEKVNDNTVLARNTTKEDVRSLTLKLASMADSRITETLDPENGEKIEVKVFIDFAGVYVEEIWSKTYL